LQVNRRGPSKQAMFSQVRGRWYYSQWYSCRPYVSFYTRESFGTC